MDRDKVIGLLKAKNESGKAFMILGIGILLSIVLLFFYAEEVAYWMTREMNKQGLHLDASGVMQAFNMFPTMFFTACIVIAGGYLYALKYVGWAVLLGLTLSWPQFLGTEIHVMALIAAWIFTTMATIATSETYMGTIYMRP